MSVDPRLASMLERRFPRMCAGIHLKNHTTWRIGGDALSIEITDIDILGEVLSFLHSNEIPWFILGMGSNVLAPSGGCGHLILRLTGKLGKTVIAEDGSDWMIEAGGGSHLPSLAGAACMHGAGGLEFAVGIPGTAGGAVFMNAGAYGRSISDMIETVTAFDHSGKKRVLSAEECGFGYRTSRFQEEPMIIAFVNLRLCGKDPAELRKKASEVLKLRREKFPLDLPNAGSVFRRPEHGPPPGWLVEQSGMKGFRIGDAQVSSVHANFVVNIGDATSADVVSLIGVVRDRVKKDSGILLREEIRYIPGQGELS